MATLAAAAQIVAALCSASRTGHSRRLAAGSTAGGIGFQLADMQRLQYNSDATFALTGCDWHRSCLPTRKPSTIRAYLQGEK